MTDAPDFDFLDWGVVAFGDTVRLSVVVGVNWVVHHGLSLLRRDSGHVYILRSVLIILAALRSSVKAK